MTVQPFFKKTYSGEFQLNGTVLDGLQQFKWSEDRFRLQHLSIYS